MRATARRGGRPAGAARRAVAFVLSGALLSACGGACVTPGYPWDSTVGYVVRGRCAVPVPTRVVVRLRGLAQPARVEPRRPFVFPRWARTPIRRTIE